MEPSAPRLTIILPYRNRAAHLAHFVPHVSTYFARDVLASRIDYCVIVVEQEPGLPFNRGALINIGFCLTEHEADYICIHDVDYLPVWADYSLPQTPTPIVWYGAETRPVAPGRSSAGVSHNLDNFFGAAVLVPSAQFRQVDGAANDYWGWGWEDTDLRARFLASGIVPSRRKGTFTPLDHDSNGYRIDGSPAPIAQVNAGLFEQRWAPGATPVLDGLKTLRFDVLTRAPVQGVSPERPAVWEHMTVRLHGRPSAKQMAAFAPPQRPKPAYRVGSGRLRQR